jgi:hypothetical protein
MTPDAFMETPIGKLQRCVLAIMCFDGCERLASCSLKRLATRYGSRLQLRAVLRRLRCSGCGRPPARVATSDADRGGEHSRRGATSSRSDWLGLDEDLR